MEWKRVPLFSKSGILFRGFPSYYNLQSLRRLPSLKKHVFSRRKLLYIQKNVSYHNNALLSTFLYKIKLLRNMISWARASYRHDAKSSSGFRHESMWNPGSSTQVQKYLCCEHIIYMKILKKYMWLKMRQGLWVVAAVLHNKYPWLSSCMCGLSCHACQKCS